MNIFVAKLNFDTRESDLRSLFSQFGEIDSVKIITDKHTGKSKGYGFVEMPHDDEGQEAINALNNTELDRRTIVVKKAEPRERKSWNSGGRRDFNKRY